MWNRFEQARRGANRQRRAWALALSLALAAVGVAGATTIGLPAPAGARGGPPVRVLDGVGKVDAAYCTQSCHLEIAAEWRGSLHQQAWKDPIFLKAYDLEPVAFCRGCHAPEASPGIAPTAKAMDEGVSCTTCHVESGRVQGSHPQQGTPHAFRLAPALATDGACASCHQFDFPKEARKLSRSPMQDTVAEWQASSFSSTSCQDCHMQKTGEGDKRHRRHDFRVVGDDAILREAIVANADRTDDETVVLSLESGKVGHAFPTGDMFRRLEVRAFGIDAKGQVVSTAKSVELARVFRDVPRDPDSTRDLGHQRVEIADTRLGPPGTRTATRTITLRVPAAKGLRVRWEVAYQRMMHPLAQSFGLNLLEDEVIVAKGLLPLRAPTGP